MEIEQLLSFSLASFLMALMPGPDNLFVMTESLHKGKMAGIWLALGLNSGIIVHTALAVTGVSFLIQESELAFDIIKYGGLLYLMHLLYKTINEKASTNSLDLNEIINYSRFVQFKTGILMNVLNPKVTLFFLAFLPQFVSQSSSMSFKVQLSILGAIFMLIGFLTFASIALMADGFRAFFESSKFNTISRWFKIIVLSLIIVFLVIN